MEKPIVTTDLGFSRSICQDEALYFTPCHPRSPAEQITHLVDNPALYRDLYERGRYRRSAFDTPAQRAEKILAICEGLVQLQVTDHAVKSVTR